MHCMYLHIKLYIVQMGAIVVTFLAVGIMDRFDLQSFCKTCLQKAIKHLHRYCAGEMV